MKNDVKSRCHADSGFFRQVNLQDGSCPIPPINDEELFKNLTLEQCQQFARHVDLFNNPKIDIRHIAASSVSDIRAGAQGVSQFTWLEPAGVFA